MKLFDDKIKRVARYAKYSESYYEYLNISATPEFIAIREKIEEWFTHYPEEEKHEFIKRFQIDNNEQFLSAFFELLLHELLLKLNYKIVVHPYLSHNKKRPDFLVRNNSGEEFYLEVAIATSLSQEEMGKKKLLNTVFDIINEVKTFNFFIGVEINKLPDKPIPVSNLKNFLQKKLDELNPDYCEDIINKFGLDAIPKWDFNYNGFEIRFKPIPKDKSYRHKQTTNPIGMVLYPFQFIDSIKPILTALKYKAKKYGKLDKPYIIALNLLDRSVHKEDIFESLFGSIIYNYDIENSCFRNSNSLPIGFWYSKKGPTYSRVSAIILALNLYPWSIAISDFKIYHNPWAKDPYSGNICIFPQFKLSVDKYEEIPGISINKILGISEKWPYDLISSINL